MANLEKVMNDLNSLSDGQSAFFRINRSMDDCLGVIWPTSLGQVARFMFTRCLMMVPAKAEDPEFTDSAEVLTHGRWTYVITVDDLISYTHAADEINDDLRKRNMVMIKSLVRLGMFFSFTVKVGGEKFTIYTYNRYVQFNGVYWPQHWRDNDKDFSPPLVPLILSGLSKASSYKNAIGRMCEFLESEFGSKIGWRTTSQVRAHVKDAFCRDFLQNMISRMVPSARAKFRSYEDANAQPDDYVKEVHAIARSLPEYEGVDLTGDLILNLRLPKAYSDALREKINKVQRRNSVIKVEAEDMIVHNEEVDKSAKNAPSQAICESAKNTPHCGVQGAKNTPHCGVQGAFFALNTQVETDVSTMNTNELDIVYTVPYRGMESRGMNIEVSDITKNDTSNTVQKDEIDDLENQAEPTSSNTNVSYNDSMQTSSPDHTQVDTALTQTQVQILASSSPFNVPDKKPCRSKSKAKKSEDQSELAVYEQMKSDHGRIKGKEKVAARLKDIFTISGFVTAFRSIIKGAIPGAYFPSAQTEKIEYIEAQNILDSLKNKGALDEAVLRGWMLHTANQNGNHKGYFSVSMMRKTWNTWAPNVPSPDFLARKNAAKKVVVPKKNVIFDSMGQIFASGVSAATTFRACQSWGITITAFYLEAIGHQAEPSIKACLVGKPAVEIKSIFSVTVKFEGAGMGTAVWRDQFAGMLAKAGNLDEFKANDFDKAKVSDFMIRIDNGETK